MFFESEGRYYNLDNFDCISLTTTEGINYINGIFMNDKCIYVSVKYFYEKYQIKTKDENLFRYKFWNVHMITKNNNTLPYFSIDTHIMEDLVKYANSSE